MAARGRQGGRRSKPSALKVLHGDFEHDPQRENKKEPKPKRGKPICPKHITGVGRTEWHRICKLLTDTTVLTMDCGPALETYCRSYKLLRQAYEHLDEHGTVLIINDADGNKKAIRSPYCADMREHSLMCIKMLVEFGLTPSSRTRLQIEDATSSRQELAKKYLG